MNKDLALVGPKLFSGHPQIRFPTFWHAFPLSTMSSRQQKIRSSPAPYLTHYAVQSRMALIIGSFLTGILLCEPTQFDNVDQRTGSSLDKVSADRMPSPH
jgi:hypothetical protein